ncbi:hypothetical protein HOD08_00455 [bacterium]|nr:hypothetical protein [bacterium]
MKKNISLLFLCAVAVFQSACAVPCEEGIRSVAVMEVRHIVSQVESAQEHWLEEISKIPGFLVLCNELLNPSFLKKIDSEMLMPLRESAYFWGRAQGLYRLIDKIREGGEAEYKYQLSILKSFISEWPNFLKTLVEQVPELEEKVCMTLPNEVGPNAMCHALATMIKECSKSKNEDLLRRIIDFLGRYKSFANDFDPNERSRDEFGYIVGMCEIKSLFMTRPSVASVTRFVQAGHGLTSAFLKTLIDKK